MSCCYDLGMLALERTLLGSWRQRLCAPLSGRVLDLGAGTGANFPYLSSSCQVVAVEPDPGMAGRAAARRVRLGASWIDLVEGRAEALPHADESFDHVLSTLVLCSVQNPREALTEIRRVLRPGGRLHFLEHVRGQGAAGAWHDRLNPWWCWLSGGCHLNRRTPTRMAALGLRMEEIGCAATLLGVPFLWGRAVN